MIVQRVRFRPGLSEADVRATINSRIGDYRQVPGLLQKYYLRFADTGEWGGLYFWDSQESLDRFRASEFAQTIAAAYRVEEPPNVETAEVAVVLHSDLEPTLR